MYDLEWAHRVYTTFCIDRTRTINLDKCIIQRIAEMSGMYISREQVQKTIIYAITNPKKQKLWRLYKSLVKKSPLNRESLDVVSRELWEVYWDKSSLEKQLLLF